MAEGSLSVSTQYTWYSKGIDPLCEHEVRQFLRHAHRVRSLQVPFDNHFHLLSVLPIKTFLFPKLLSLSMVLHTNGYLHLFLSPTLRRCFLPLIHPDLKLIATCCATLEDLTIKVPSQSTADELSLLSDGIRLCKRLVTLYCPPHLDNNLLLEAMASWPHICSLELSDMETVPTVTFRGLFTALSRCPNLLRLNMSMDVAGIDIDPTAESFQHTTLESLKPTRSRVADAEAVARIPFSMLPRVDKVTDRWDPWNTEISFQKHWDEVNRHLDLLNGREPQRSQSPESEQDTDYCC
ncbi:hypothetical protein BD769DRAFT_1673282 [Suillus cothurnatus]|nr:hypothetical protein BD769DRAFT_1673282 [Suillus cothurnatus]